MKKGQKGAEQEWALGFTHGLRNKRVNENVYTGKDWQRNRQSDGQTSAHRDQENEDRQENMWTPRSADIDLHMAHARTHLAPTCNTRMRRRARARARTHTHAHRTIDTCIHKYRHTSEGNKTEQQSGQSVDLPRQAANNKNCAAGHLSVTAGTRRMMSKVQTWQSPPWHCVVILRCTDVVWLANDMAQKQTALRHASADRKKEMDRND